MEESGHLTLYVGPMYSQKTTNLVNKMTLYADIGLRCLMVNHLNDQRVADGVTHGDEILSTHNSSYGSLSAKIKRIKVKELREIDVTNFQAIGVDEGQFYPDLFDVIDGWVNKLNKKVVVAGLNGSFAMRPIGQILDLIPLANDLFMLNATCKFCLKETGRMVPASFSLRLNGGEEEINIHARYEAACRKHYLEYR